MAKNIIDVSKWQGIIDWEKVKTQIDGAILRCGYGSDRSDQDDEQFNRNASECERLGIPYGVYLYSYATSESMAKSEAAHILRLIKGKKLTLPVYLDCEKEKAAIRAYAPKACAIIGEIIEKAGYTFGVYANLTWWNNYLIGVTAYTRWVAQYNKECTYKGKYDMWQYSSVGHVNGINSYVDMNYCYTNFGAVEKKSIEELAREVIEGKWGVNPKRKEKLKAAGYNAEAVQKRVNDIYNNAYKVKITANVLRVRSGAGTNYKQVGSVAHNAVCEILYEAAGQGADKWGKLKDGTGWIALDWTKKV